MEHSNHKWVADRLTEGQPQWAADVGRGRVLLLERTQRRRKPSFQWKPALAALACVAVAAISHEVWQTFRITRVDVVRLDLSHLPLDTNVSLHGANVGVRDVDEAERRAGFRPRLPFAVKELMVTGTFELRQTVRTDKLRAALEHHGAALEMPVPAEWDGVTLRANIGPMVIAELAGDGVQVVQTRPVEMLLPSGFPLERFVETVFRGGGMPWREAREFARKFTSHPSWLLEIPKDEEAVIEDIALPSGPGLLITDPSEKDAKQRFSVIFSTADRVFLVSAPTRARALEVAGLL